MLRISQGAVKTSGMTFNDLPVGRMRDVVEHLSAQILPLVEWLYAPEKPGRGRCVLISHIVRDVLHRFGVFDATCLSCVVVCHNALAAQYTRESENLSPEESGRLAMQYKDRGGHILVIGDPNEPDGDGGWSGHLAVVAGGFLIDFALGQFSRPHKQLDLESVAVPLMRPAPWPDQALVTALVGVDGATITWYATPSNQRYQSSRAALPETRTVVVEYLVKSIRDALQVAA